MADGKPGRPRIYPPNSEQCSYAGEWRKNFTKEWEEVTALIRRIEYKEYKEHQKTFKSDSLYLS